MFDIGFSEIVVIGVVALVVIGPERLPKTARTLGLLYGRLQRYVTDVKADISREMELDELRRLQREMQGAAREFEQSVQTAANNVATGVRNVERELNAGAAETHESRAPDVPPATPLAPPADSTLPRQAALPGFDKIQ
ncbi:MAG: Sec-independent protein translocase protein TatB [Casimicrobiaceae bacterium]